MSCQNNSPKYANKIKVGLDVATSLGDGYSVVLQWFKAYPSPPNWTLAYNLYYSTDIKEVFPEEPKFVITDPAVTKATLTGFKPGDVVYFAVRATEWPDGDSFLAMLPESDGFRFYSESALSQDISDSQLTIPLDDIVQFPSYGVVQIGSELIRYSSVDLLNSNLLVYPSGRGYLGTNPTLHTVDGYDGYVYSNPLVRYFKGFEDGNVAAQMVHNKFQFTEYPRTNADGYKDKSDVVYNQSSLNKTEEQNTDLPEYDFVGWHRDHPQEILSGSCIGTYMGGTYFCADGYNGVGNQLRGLSLSELNNQRITMQLEADGDRCVLLRRMTEGKVSFHYSNTIENTAYRGLDNSGTDLVHGYDQFFNLRRSDRRILVRFSPTKENIKREDSGLENEFQVSCYTTPFPVIKDGDVIVRFNYDNTEEWRYEIIDVERGRLAVEGSDTTPAANSGLQKFTAVRIRKTDPIYQIGIYKDIATLPAVLATGIGMVSGPGGIPPHTHEIHISEKTTSIGQVNQFTTITYGHNHPIENGVLKDVLGHTHTIMLP
jgi:hypothetical protein